MSDPSGRADVDRDHLIDALTSLGMNKIEADVYLRLSTAGPQKAGPLSKAMGWSRAETYRVLQRLVENEFVEAALTRPVEFRAVPVAALFSRLQLLQQERLARIDASRSAVQDRVARLQQRATDPGTDEAGFAVIHDRARVLAAADRMVMEAQRSLSIHVTSSHVLRALGATGLLASIERRGREEIEVRIVLPVEDRSSLAAPVAHLARRLPPGQRDACMLLADGRETLCWLNIVPTTRLQTEDENAIWTDAPNFVSLQEMLFERLWASAEA